MSARYEKKEDWCLVEIPPKLSREHEKKKKNQQMDGFGKDSSDFLM
jgi:hypothetical protein